MNEELKLHIDVCPICGSRTAFLEEEEPDRICINRCVLYNVSETDDFNDKILGVMILLDESDRNLLHPDDGRYYSLLFKNVKRANELKERIEYWRENDRYLAEILANGVK